MRRPKKTVSILLPLDLYDSLHQHAVADDHTMSGEIRQILRGYTEYMARGGVSWCRNWQNRGIIQFQPSAEEFSE